MVQDLAISPDGALLATASQDGTAKVWDISKPLGSDRSPALLVAFTQHVRPATMSNWVLGVAFSPDGCLVASAHADAKVRVWNPASGQERLTLVGAEGTRNMTAVAFSPDGTLIAGGNANGLICVWEAATGTLVHVLAGHSAGVFDLDFSADGRLLASASFDLLGKIWDVQSGEEVATLQGHAGRVIGVAFSPDGGQVATGGEDGTVRLYAVRVEDLVALARSRVTRSLTRQEREKYLHLGKSSVQAVRAGGGGVEPVSVEFVCEGACVRGRFFRAAVRKTPAATLLLFPGWPGDPDDVLGVGALLAERGINVCTFNFRGLQQSEGIYTQANTQQDIRAALQWLRQAEVQQRFRVEPAELALGGHCGGGGMAMAYAAQDPSVRRVISIAGNDHGEFIRELQRNAAMAEQFRRYMLSTRVPQGLARFDYDAGSQELIDHQDVYGLRENAAKLADRSILLLGGWEDQQVTIDQFLLPLYRALKGAGAGDVTFLVYHTDHEFSNVRQRLASDIADWLLRDWSN